MLRSLEIPWKNLEDKLKDEDSDKIFGAEEKIVGNLKHKD
jgi:hypothetical protein